MDKYGENLIFLISQPRSGSTLLQHILGSHPEIHTLPEPWFMLHLVYGTRKSGIRTEYNAGFAQRALEDFLRELTEGEEVFIVGVRKMANYLYERALEGTGKELFLDKTPRYYLIIPELYRIFPRAKFIFLIRNPLSVLSSIIETNFRGVWHGLFTTDRKHDILTAPDLILKGIEHLGDKGIVVHYESLVMKPEETVSEVCEKIEVKFIPDMIKYGDRVQFSGDVLVDPKSIYKHEAPVTDYVNLWQKKFDTEQKIYIAKKYLSTLGPEVVERLGYSYSDLMSALDTLSFKKDPYIIHWNILMMSSQERSRWDNFRIQLLSSLHGRGLRETLRITFLRFFRQVRHPF